jgi:hypothetical protein
MSLNEEGCGEKVLEWVDHSADVLFVIGFCIIVFVKGCFVAILKYEIKEMIQKIKLLNGEDDGRQAAMNELIGLTSMYEGGRHDDGEPGEREGLMASAATGGVSGDTNNTLASTNIDAIESDTRRKDSIASNRDHHNCLVGNNVVGPNRKMSYVGAIGASNHVGSSTGAPGCNNLMMTSNSIGSAAGSSHNKPMTLPLTSVTLPDHHHHPHHHHHLQHQHHHVHPNDIEDDFDSGSAYLGKPKLDNLGAGVESGNSSGVNKSNHRNENGGRSLPRNGNNNTTGIGGVTGSASAPIPIDSMAKA